MEGSETTKRLKYMTKNQKTGVKFTSVFVLSEDMKLPCVLATTQGRIATR